MRAFPPLAPLARVASGALLLIVSASGCAGAQDAGRVRLPDAAERRSAAIPVTLVGESRDDTLFTSITGIDMDSRGRIHIGDWTAARVAVLDSTGALVRTVGRRGLGPGEFRGMGSVQVLPGDSILAYDPAAVRLSVFAPDAQAPAYVLNLAAALGGPAPLELRRTHGNDAYLALFRPAFVATDTAPRKDVLRLLDLEGRPRGEPLRAFASRSFLRADQGRSFAVMPNPFGTEGLYALGPGDALHLAWSGSLGVESTDLAGARTGGFSAEYEPPAVTPGDVRDAAAALPERMAAAFRPVLADSVPERWPALRALLADDAGRLWLGLNGAAAREVEWAVFAPGGRYLGSVFLPREVDVRAVRGGRLVGVRTGETGVPSVVIYRLDAQPEHGRG